MFPLPMMNFNYLVKTLITKYKKNIWKVLFWKDEYFLFYNVILIQFILKMFYYTGNVVKWHNFADIKDVFLFFFNGHKIITTNFTDRILWDTKNAFFLLERINNTNVYNCDKRAPHPTNPLCAILPV